MIKPYNHRLMSDRNPIIFQGTGKCRFPGDHRCLFSAIIRTEIPIFQKGLRTMKQEMTELVCIIDRSGSMSGFESDTIGSFNGMIEKQKKLPGTCYLTVVLFNQTMDMVYDREDISHVPPMTEKDYVAGGCTAMLDAVGLSIRRMEKLLSHKPKDARPDHVVFFITTDGCENASTRFSWNDIHRLISKGKEMGWTFIFSGADIDVKETADRMGIDEDRAYAFQRTPAGIAQNMVIVDECLEAIRKGMK